MITEEEAKNLTIDEIRELKWDRIRNASFRVREIIGRKIYDSISRIPHEYTNGQFDSFDASATAKTSTFNIEIKYRFILREKYDDKGYYLEKIKYDALMDAYKETGSIPLFFTFVRGGVGYYWDLRKLNPVWKWELATSTSASGTYGEKKELKEVCHPFPSEGVEISW